jgi:hypothetical protein
MYSRRVADVAVLVCEKLVSRKVERLYASYFRESLQENNDGGSP